jgi:hypothetical protein
MIRYMNSWRGIEKGDYGRSASILIDCSSREYEDVYGFEDVILVE